MKSKKELGDWGESEAEAYLKKIGFEILECQYKMGKAEADLIALDGKILVFVEVKTRSTDQWGKPEEFVDEKKEIQLTGLAEEFLEKHGLTNEIRFDIVGIIKGKGHPQIKHIPDVF